jgi:DNA-binding response OmpR family regulator
MIGTARTVRQAAQLAALHCSDVAVIDIRLANGDQGTTVAAHLRNTTKTKILFSTGNGDNLSSLEDLGDAVMIKPYRLRDIGRALSIIDELARYGQTDLTFPRNSCLLALVEP